MKKWLCVIIGIVPMVSFAKTFDIQVEIQKCQKCHGLKFDKEVLNSSKKISSFSKKELQDSFERYLNSPRGGKAGLMKLIIKKYSKEELDAIAEYIYTQKH
jgi:cytochrome c553